MGKFTWEGRQVFWVSAQLGLSGPLGFPKHSSSETFTLCELELTNRSNGRGGFLHRPPSLASTMGGGSVPLNLLRARPSKSALWVNSKGLSRGGRAAECETGG